MSIIQNRICQFLLGAIGTLTLSFSLTILHELILQHVYVFSRTYSQQNQFRFTVMFLLFPSLISSFLGWVVAEGTGQIVRIPRKNVIRTAALIFCGNVCYYEAIVQTSSYFVFMIKTLSLLSLIFVGVYYSRVKDRKLKLGKPKLIVGGLALVGILMLGSQLWTTERKESSFLGVLLTLIVFIIDSLIPDFQAEIKEKFKPRPIDFLFQISLWIFIFSLVYSAITLEPIQLFPTFPIIIISICIFCGQMFVYYLICNFKQHIAYIVINSKDIMTVLFVKYASNRNISISQLVGMLILLAAGVFDCIDQNRIAKQQDNQRRLLLPSFSSDQFADDRDQPNNHPTQLEAR